MTETTTKTKSDVGVILACAIARDPVVTMERLGISQARVSQLALHALDDPRTHLEHPEAAATLKARLTDGRRRRTWR